MGREIRCGHPKRAHKPHSLSASWKRRDHIPLRSYLGADEHGRRSPGEAVFNLLHHQDRLFAFLIAPLRRLSSMASGFPPAEIRFATDCEAPAIGRNVLIGRVRSYPER